jgi:cytochrome c oxidase cbb3-type subunit 3
MSPRLLAAALLLWAAMACGVDDDARQHTAGDGAALYASYCALCHGDNAEGYTADNASALANDSFLAAASDAFLTRSIERGRPGTSMSAWGASHGGPLSDAQIALLVRHLRGASAQPPVPVDDIQVTGSAARAQAYYDVKCKQCHADKGLGGMYMSIANPEFLSVASDGFLRYAIREGRPGTPMQAFTGELPDQIIDDLVVLIRSWQTQPGDSSAELPQWPSDGAILNLEGPEPALDAGRYITVEALHAALERAERLLLADARTPSDYVSMHIQGAVSVPFYEPEKYLDRLPEDVTIVAYCGCPHAASGSLVDKLAQRGYTRLKVLDEGYFVWRDNGYAVRAGVSP